MDTPDDELRKLCDQYPAISVEDREKDEAWLRYQALNANLKSITGIAPERLAGKIVAVYNQQLVAVGDDETELRVALSKKFNVHPERFALHFISESSVQKKAVILSFSVTGCVVMVVFVIFVGIAAISALGTKSNATFSRIGSAVS